MIRRVSVILPDPDLDEYDRPDKETWLPTQTITEDWGTLRIEAGATWQQAVDGTMTKVLNGVDITTVNDHATLISFLDFGEPYGELRGSLSFPGLTPWSWAPWLEFGTNIDVWRVLPLPLQIQYGRTEVPYWHGFVAAPTLNDAHGATEAFTVDLWGALFGECSLRDHQPVLTSAEVDCGTAIARDLYPDDYSRPFAPYRFQFIAATTNIDTAERGSRGMKVIDYVDSILAIAQEDDVQWTVSRAFDETNFPRARTYYLRPKSESLVGAIDTFTVTLGMDGVEVNLSQEGSETPNTIYGEGVAPSGERWRNSVWPMLTDAEDTPAYPGPMQLGDTDLDFSYDAVTALQSRLRAGGWPDVEITGVFDADTVTALEAQQTAAGRPVDGEINGAADWNSVFETGSGWTDVSSGFFLPLGAVSAAQPYLFASNGDVRDTNPDYDGRLQVDRTVSFPQGTRKSRAKKWAKRAANQGSIAPWVGKVTLRTDPQEAHRFGIREGGFLRLNGPKGNVGMDLYIAGVKHGIEEDGSPTTLTVSERPFDLLDLSERIARNEEAASADLAKSYRALRTRPQRAFRDAVGWDRESGAGQISPRSLSAGWNVIRFVGAERGQIQAIKATTSGPAQKFALALFGKPITAAQVAGLVADPLAEEPDAYGWWNVPAIQSDLDDYWFIEAWGEFEQAAGYWPGRESDDHAVTGKMVDALSWTFVSGDAPFLWLAVWMPASGMFKADMRIVIEE